MCSLVSLLEHKKCSILVIQSVIVIVDSILGTGISQNEDGSGGEFSVIPTQDFPQMSPSLTLNPTPSSMDIAQSIAESAFPDSSVYGTTLSMSVSSITVSSQYLSNQQFIPSSVYSSEHVLTSSPRPILTILSFFSNAVQSTDIPVVQSSPEFVIAPQSIAIVGPDVTSILILSSGSVESMANPEMSVMASSTPFIGVRTTTTAVSTPPTMLPTGMIVVSYCYESYIVYYELLFLFLFYRSRREHWDIRSN